MALRLLNYLLYTTGLKHFLTLIIFFIFPLYSFSQDITGNIEGGIVDSTGSPLAGTNISIQNAGLQGSRGATSN